MNSDTGIKLPFSEDAERGLISSLLLGGEKVAVEITVPKRHSTYRRISCCGKR